MGSLLEKALKMKKDSKKIPDCQDDFFLPEEITPGDIDQIKRRQATFENQKVHPGELSKKVPKSNCVSKKPDVGFDAKNQVVGDGPTIREIDQKSNEFNLKLEQKLLEIDLRIEKRFNEFNERQLKLLRIGLKHEFTIENMMIYFKEIKKTKLYELRRYFSDSSSFEIDKMLKYFYSTGVVIKDKDNWYSLK